MIVVTSLGLGFYLTLLLVLKQEQRGSNKVQPLNSDRIYTDAEKVVVDVYYEALCPDSRYFIVKQLYPAWEQIGPQFMDVRFKPYGKASHSKGRTGYTFNCQHGPVECDGNKYHACATEILDGNDDLLMNYIKCLVSDYYDPYNRANECASKLEINFDPIKECAEGQRGSELLARFGDETHSLRPKITFIPTIVLNGDQGNQKSILRSFLPELCKKYKARRPEACKEAL